MSDSTQDQTTLLIVTNQVAELLSHRMLQNKLDGGLGNAVLLEGEVISTVLVAMGIHSPTGDIVHTELREVAEEKYKAALLEHHRPTKQQTPTLKIV